MLCSIYITYYVNQEDTLITTLTKINVNNDTRFARSFFNGTFALHVGICT